MNTYIILHCLISNFLLKYIGHIFISHQFAKLISVKGENSYKVMVLLYIYIYIYMYI